MIFRPITQHAKAQIQTAEMPITRHLFLIDLLPLLALVGAE